MKKIEYYLKSFRIAFIVVMLFYMSLILNTYRFFYYIIIYTDIIFCLSIIYPKSEEYDLFEEAVKKITDVLQSHRIALNRNKNG